MLSDQILTRNFDLLFRPQRDGVPPQGNSPCLRSATSLCIARDTADMLGAKSVQRLFCSDVLSYQPLVPGGTQE